MHRLTAPTELAVLSACQDTTAASSDYRLVGSRFKRKCGLEVSTGAALGFFDAYTVQP